jgi:glycosyltransferase involved in cell wall biosynthesis
MMPRIVNNVFARRAETGGTCGQSKRSRLAVLAPHFPEYTLRYAREMSAYREVLVCVDEAQMAAEYAGRDFSPGEISKLEKVRFKTPLDLVRILWLILRFRPSVVHVQEAVGPRRGFFNACAVTLMKPIALTVLTVHDPAPHPGRDAIAARAAWARSYVRRMADLVVVHGRYCAQQYRGLGVPARQTVVISEHGLILEPSTLAPSKSSRLKLYFFGRMEAYKGLDVLLEAAELLHEDGVSFELKIAGRGPELDRLQERFCQLPEVEVLNGFVPPSEVVSSIQEANCVVLPYLTATQSGVLAAAFAGRRFVVASETGGLVDVVSHLRNGYLFPPGDAAKLASAIKMLAETPGLREELERGAQLTATEKLNWSRIVADLDAVFSDATRTG